MNAEVTVNGKTYTYSEDIVYIYISGNPLVEWAKCETMLVYCNDCDRITEAERFSNSASVESEIQETKNLRLNPEAPESIIDFRNKILENLEKIKGIITGRNSKRKCLECGSEKIIDVDSIQHADSRLFFVSSSICIFRFVNSNGERITNREFKIKSSVSGHLIDDVSECG